VDAYRSASTTGPREIVKIVKAIAGIRRINLEAFRPPLFRDRGRLIRELESVMHRRQQGDGDCGVGRMINASG